MYEFNAAQNDRRRPECLEAKHRSKAAFDPSLIVLHDVVERLALAEFDLRLMFGIVGLNRGRVRSALIDRDDSGNAMALDGPSKKPQCRFAIALGGSNHVTNMLEWSLFGKARLQGYLLAISFFLNIVIMNQSAQRLINDSPYRLDRFWIIGDNMSLTPVHLVNSSHIEQISQHLQKPLEGIAIYPDSRTNISEFPIALNSDTVHILENNTGSTFLSKSYPNLGFVSIHQEKDALQHFFGRSEGPSLRVSGIDKAKQLLSMGKYASKGLYDSDSEDEGERLDAHKSDLEKAASSDPQKVVEEYKQLITSLAVTFNRVGVKIIPSGENENELRYVFAKPDTNASAHSSAL